MKKLIKICIFICVLSGLIGCSPDRQEAEKDAEESEVQETRKGYEEVDADKKEVRVEEAEFQRVSENQIRISWSDKLNPVIEEYQVKRQEESGEWITIGAVVSDRRVEQRSLAITDVLESGEPKQYIYRVDVKAAEAEKYKALEGNIIYASNILLCIDPGHYAGYNAVTGKEGTSYAEGDFTLELALELARILKEQYGVTSVLTRDSGTITLGGYTDWKLDSAHISLRGEKAKDSMLFISLHTNANLEYANGYETKEQPIAINKPIIIVNKVTYDTDFAIDIANAVGENLSEESYRLGIAFQSEFRKVSGRTDMTEWTDAYNDSLEEKGTVCIREHDGRDYYGVLRGATNVGKPGMIIEHGFHTVPEMRKAASSGELKTVWARADARGIAEGLGIKGRMEER